MHHAFHFTGPTNHWIEFLFASQLCEVATELIENLAVAFFAIFAFSGALVAGLFATTRCAFDLALRPLITRQQLNNLLTYTTEVGTQLDENLGGNSFAFANESEQDVLGADVVMTQLQCFTQRQFENFFGTRCERNMTRWRRSTLANNFFNLSAYCFERNTQSFQSLRSHSFTFVNESEQDVLCADIAVIQQSGFFLGQHNNTTGPICEAFKHALPFVEVKSLVCHSICEEWWYEVAWHTETNVRHGSLNVSE